MVMARPAYGPARGFEEIDISSAAVTLTSVPRAIVCWHTSSSAIELLNLREIGSTSDVGFPVFPGAPTVFNVAPGRIGMHANVKVIVLY